MDCNLHSESPCLFGILNTGEGRSDTTTIDLNRCKEALNAFNKATTLVPKFDIAWANRCFPAYHLKDYQTALDSCNKALDLDPENREEMNEVIYTNKGYVQLKTGNLLESLQSFSTALNIDSKIAEAWIGKGTVLHRSGRYSEALDSFNQAYKLNHPLAQRSLELVQQQLSQSA